VTIYQMEIPFNTTIFKEMKVMGQAIAPVATWKLKREWVEYAFAELERAGYTVGSAYTAVKDPSRSKFLYRDLLWSGADMLGIGVASFSHVQGVHYQNEHDFSPYCAKLNRGELPIFRAFPLTEEQRMIRELVLQLKRGQVRGRYFRGKFGVDIQEHFAAPAGRLREQGFLVSDADGWRLNRDGLLQVDRLLYEFFLPEHRNVSHA